MNAALPTATVSDYHAIIPSLTLPDRDDHHVLAAAIKASASYIVTFNLKDFPLQETIKHKIVPVHPDQFVLDLISDQLPLVLLAAKNQRAQLRNPPKSVTEYLDTLRKVQLSKTAGCLEPFAEDI